MLQLMSDLGFTVRPTGDAAVVQAVMDFAP